MNTNDVQYFHCRLAWTKAWDPFDSQLLLLLETIRKSLEKLAGGIFCCSCIAKGILTRKAFGGHGLLASIDLVIVSTTMQIKENLTGFLLSKQEEKIRE